MAKLTDPNRRTNTSNANEPRWLLSGFAQCGQCEAPVKVIGGRNRTPSYTCPAGQHVRRNAPELDRYVTRWVTGLLDRDDEGELLKPPPAAHVDVAAVRAELRKIDRNRQRARDRADQVDEDGRPLMTEAELRRDLAKYNRERTAAEAKLATSATPDPLPEFRPGARGGLSAAQVWEALPVARRRAVVQTLIEWVKIDRLPTRGRAYPIETAVRVREAEGLRPAA